MLGFHTNYISCQVHVSNTKLLQLLLRLLKGTLVTRIDMKKSGIINKTSRTTWMSLRIESESDVTTFCVKVLTAWLYFVRFGHYVFGYLPRKAGRVTAGRSDILPISIKALPDSSNTEKVTSLPMCNVDWMCTADFPTACAKLKRKICGRSPFRACAWKRILFPPEICWGMMISYCWWKNSCTSWDV